MLSDSINWCWNTGIGVSKEILKSPKRILDLVATSSPVEKPAPEIITQVVEVFPSDMINIPSSSRWFIRFAGLSGATAVALGAYGSHVFYRKDHPEELKQVYETANSYHFMHTLALFGVPLCRHPKIAGTLLSVGTIVFSGTCYYYALTGSRTVRQYTPYGGMMLIAGWLAMIL